ncbi:MAG: thermonuclease family protein [Rhodospirillales bacterium]|nr:thermonuclease family protein [Rhodospirillales bacterium]
MRPWSLLCGVVLLLSRLAFGAEIAGVATAKNGDSVFVAGVDVRLFGIDAPEWRQQCELNGGLYPCGQAAHLALATRVNGKVLRCEQLDYDMRNKRPVARCFVDNLDVGGWMVAQGLAVAYRRYSAMYADEEARAKAARVGIWQGDFVAPEQWRQGARLAAEGTGSPTVLLRDTGTGNCAIKGNISQRGERIYHLPGQLNYADTRIDPARGERWFCTEADARAAGWRKARQ